jgi:hypothetical protein
MRKITSLTLAITGIIELITSVVLYIMPAGRVAYWSDYRFLGLSKTEWGNIHLTVGTLFVVMGGIHIYLNWRLITTYIKNRAKKISLFTTSFNAALLLSFYVTIGTLYSLPPMNYIVTFGEHLSAAANEKYGEPPYGHAELSSLHMFCSRLNIDLAQATVLLNEAGIKIKDAQQPVGEIAKTSGVTPQQLYNIIKSAQIGDPGESSRFPENPFPGFGKKTIKEICQTYNLPLARVLTKLKDAGYSLQADDTVKEISSNNDTTPMKIFETFKEIAQ